MTILACDLGGSRLKVGVVQNERVLGRTLALANANTGLAQQLPTLKSNWLQLLVENHLQLGQCAAVTVAFPSLIDNATGRVCDDYDKFPDAPRLDLRAWAREHLGLPLAIENDARMALIGEWRAGVGRGVNNLAMITLGTGLGTSAIVEGKVLRGAHGEAGVLFGHTTVRYGGRLCTCGNIGCAEAEASTRYLSELARQSPGFEHSPLRAAAPLDYALVFQHAAAGDPCAIALRDHSLAVWSALAVNLVHAYGPELLILGGGIMASGDVILPALSSHVARYARTPCRVVASELGETAALVAGQWLAQEQCGIGSAASFVPLRETVGSP